MKGGLRLLGMACFEKQKAVLKIATLEIGLDQSRWRKWAGSENGNDKGDNFENGGKD